MTSNVRESVISSIAGLIDEIKLNHPLRVGIDGVDCSGKTRLADELMRPLEQLGRTIVRVSIDGFHNPRSVRYRQGRESPAGFYDDTFDNAAIVKCVLAPLGPGGDLRYKPRKFDFKTDSPVSLPWNSVVPDSIVLFDGIFLHRAELVDYWDFTIFIAVSFDETLRRAKERDQYLFGNSDDVEAIYTSRYIPGQKLYLESVRPDEKANIVLDNSDVTNPIIRVSR